jgi:hypothetical protein
VSGIQQKLDAAFLYSDAIDVTTSGRRRDKLREELTLAEIDITRPSMNSTSRASWRSQNAFCRSRRRRSPGATKW